MKLTGFGLKWYLLVFRVEAEPDIVNIRGLAQT